MQTKFIEAEHSDGPGNWGKFMVARFTPEEWARRSVISDEAGGGGEGGTLLTGRGWSQKHLLIFDLQTGEGAVFFPGGIAAADLAKHKIWVCPLFEPFLDWLYRQDLTDIEKLPARVGFTSEEAPFAQYGYRREGSPELSKGNHPPGSYDRRRGPAHSHK